MIRVTEINDIQRLDDIRLLWKSLCQRTRGESFFHSIAWLETWWRHFGRGNKLKVLLSTLAEKPIGILPLVVRRIDSSFGPVRMLGYPLSGWETTCGPIGPNAAATLIASMRHLRDSPRDWDVIDLLRVDRNRRDGGRTRNAMRAAGLSCLSRPRRASAVVELEPNWTAYWANRPVELRRRFHRAQRRLAQFGRLEHVRFRAGADPRDFGESLGSFDDDCRWRLFDELARLRQVSETPAVARSQFLHEVHAAAVRAGAADLNLLRLNDRPIAAAYGFHCGGRVEVVELAATPGFETDARRALVARMMQDGASRGDTAYTFAPHITSLDPEWATAKTQTVRLTHFPLSAPRAQWLRLNQMGVRLRFSVRRWFTGLGGGSAGSSGRRASDRLPMIRKPAASL